MDPQADVTSLEQDGQSVPVRREGGSLVVPVHPSTQVLTAEWRTDAPLRTIVRAAPVGLPVEAANIRTELQVPESRWILWTILLVPGEIGLPVRQQTHTG